MTCPGKRHGTTYAYRHFGCRCPDVVERVRVKNRRHGQPGKLLAGPRCRSAVVDEIAIERACQGERVDLTIRERGIAVRRLGELGLSAREIGRRLGLSSRTVQRYRAGVVMHGKVA